MSRFVIRPFRSGEAAAVAAWAYEEPFHIYDGDPDSADDYIEIDEAGFGFYAVVDDATDAVVGFCCFGREARVRGQEEAPGIVDIGGGIDPVLVSQGLATDPLPEVMDLARSTFAPKGFRTAVAAFNQRSTRLCRRAGFEVTRQFEGPGRTFLELTRPA